MKLNSFLKQRDAELAISAVYASTEITGNVAGYGLTAPQATQISTTASAYDSAVKALEIAENQYKSAVIAKDAARATFATTFGNWMRVAYANPTVPNANFALIGLDARDDGPTPRPVQTPLELSSTPFQDGTVKLKWKRNGNTNSTSYSIEAMVEDGAWEIVAVTTLSKFTLESYAPGTQVAFRVQAIKGEQVSAYSNISTIYQSGGASLSVAA